MGSHSEVNRLAVLPHPVRRRRCLAGAGAEQGHCCTIDAHASWTLLLRRRHAQGSAEHAVAVSHFVSVEMVHCGI